jgi:hypothetical protein
VCRWAGGQADRWGGQGRLVNVEQSGRAGWRERVAGGAAWKGRAAVGSGGVGGSSSSSSSGQCVGCEWTVEGGSNAASAARGEWGVVGGEW